MQIAVLNKCSKQEPCVWANVRWICVCYSPNLWILNNAMQCTSPEHFAVLSREKHSVRQIAWRRFFWQKKMHILYSKKSVPFLFFSFSILLYLFAPPRWQQCLLLAEDQRAIRQLLINSRDDDNNNRRKATTVERHPQRIQSQFHEHV